MDSPLINHHHLPNDTCAQPSPGHHQIHIIIIRGKNEDISWLFTDDNSLIYQGLITIYQDTTSPPLPTNTPPPPGLSIVTLPLGTFRESAFMLDAIITAYNSSSSSSSSSSWSHLAFFHADRRSWHSLFTNDWILRRWAAWSPSSLSLGYAGTHCRQANAADTRDMTTRQHLHPDRSGDRGKTTTISSTVPIAWKEFLGEWLGEMPNAIQGPCCAEFIVSKKALHSRPLEFYTAAQKWITTTDTFTPMQLAYVFEYTWHYIFTGQPIIMQPQQQCLCELYGLDVLPSQFSVAPDIGVNVALGVMVGGMVGIGVVSRVWRTRRRRMHSSSW